MPSYCGFNQIVSPGGIITVEAIISTSPALLGGGILGTAAANSNAWIGATAGDIDNPKWAQIGYVWRRAEGLDSDPTLDVYIEVQAGPNDDTDYHRRFFGSPGAGAHSYGAVLDEIDGRWLFFFDGKFLAEWQHDGWRQTAAKAQFMAETNGEATVVGSLSSPCLFSKCGIETVSGVVAVDFADGEVWRKLESTGTCTVALSATDAFSVHR